METVSRDEQSDLKVDLIKGTENKLGRLLISPGKCDNRSTEIPLIPEVTWALKNDKGQNLINCAAPKVMLTYSPSFPLNQGTHGTWEH